MNNVLLEKKNTGFCGTLTGLVGLYTVFVSDPESPWSEDARRAHLEAVGEVSRILRQEAEKDGVRLRFFTQSDSFAAAECVDRSSYRTALKDAFMTARGVSSLARLNATLNARFGTDTTVFFFVLNKKGRGFAIAAEQSCVNADEYTVLFQPDRRTYLHELLHLFGAVDLYYPESIRLSALQHFPGSVMLIHGAEDVDDLTRYLIGWRNTPSEAARSVLSAAESVTDEAFKAEREKQWHRDHAVIRYETGTYYGPVRNGMKNGKARYEFNSGAVFEGTYVDDLYEGEGMIRYANGSEYKGMFHAGKESGQGVLRYKDGAIYSGAFENGHPNGEGTMRYPSGTVVRGIYKDGKLVKRTP